MTSTPPDIAAARAELAAALAQAGWSYLKAACRFSWQLNWDKNREPMPPPVESLSREQLEHLTALVRENVKSRPQAYGAAHESPARD